MGEWFGRIADDGMLQRLWTKAVGTPDYVKEEWLALERRFLQATSVSRTEGAAVAFGLMGMAMAIRARRPRPGPVCRGYTSGCMCSKCINIERVAARDRSATK